MDIHIRIVGKAGRITLNRPSALNALSYEMILAIEKALIEWRDNESVHLVIIDAVGDKAFCAGGDVQKLYNTGITGEFAYMRKFWADEYRLNAMISNYPKPYVAFMDGIVMGGGVGVSAHGSHRIVTERTMLAMPECAIGLVPDVGGSYLLANAPGHVGEFMGVTGARLSGTDAIYAGFADSLIALDKLEELKSRLEISGEVGEIAKCTIEQISPLEQNNVLLESFFSNSDLVVAFDQLKQSGNEWAIAQTKVLQRTCPLSAACTWRIVKAARAFSSIEPALELEYRFTWRSMIDGDVLEGVRALIIDKDKNPQWKVKHLEEVTDEMVSAMLAPLGIDELNLEL